ncbi:acyclic terpene utilization AtuA family protein [Sphingomonas sp.]|uniref:acyclic terpene utilization AtuA family protein n=1 Tax=Sphingomonas sp. TaxID=28214 RepID=UPI001EB22FDB|nr:acyclic terpene utilization AtuA family protein [Sphingomonas sp.]MBX3594700.1 DUF1446 domain-containing protein [Sphingomonas sp.]
MTRAAPDRQDDRVVRIGCGSGWWGDPIEPARRIAAEGRLDYLCFETMAEVTISAAQVRRRRDPEFAGYETHLDARAEAVLPACIEQGVRIVSNQGWINPVGAAERYADHARRIGAAGIRIAAVEGSLITDRILDLADTILETGAPLADLADAIVSAEVYLGVAGILEALAGGAQIVVTGRVADPSIFAAPLIHEFGWSLDDWDRLGQAHGIGHLLECGTQVTGGYFADPGFKDVPALWDLGLPIAEVSADGTAILSKLDGTGGAIDLRTVKEQMLYEVFDPAAYITPDVVVDFTTVELATAGPDRVRVAGISGHPRPDMLKASIGCLEGFVGEDWFYHAGPGAIDRAMLGVDVLRHRLAAAGMSAFSVDLLGVNALHRAATPADVPTPHEIGIRVTAHGATREDAEKIARAVDGMAVSGVGMTGKRLPGSDRVREVVGVWSALVPRAAVPPRVHWVEV